MRVSCALTCVLILGGVLFAQPPKGKLVYTPVMGSNLPGKEITLEVISDGGRLTSIEANVGKWKQFDGVVRGMKFGYLDAKGKEQTVQVGPCDGEWHATAVKIPENLQVIGVSGSYGLVMDSVQFHLTGGVKTVRFGNKNGDLDFNISVKDAGDGGKLPFVVRGFVVKASDDAFIGIGLILEGTGPKK